LLERSLAMNGEKNLAKRLSAIAYVEPPAIHIPDVAARARALREELGPFDVSVGRLVESKRVDRAIEYSARAQRLLVVVGEGPERRALARHATRLGARVRFVGEVPRAEALAYIAAADALVVASSFEGCSTVTREAAALATAVQNVATNVAPAP